MKSLTLIAFAVLALGALSLSACSSCSMQQQEQAKAAIPVTCGPGTVAQGNVCVGTVPK